MSPIKTPASKPLAATGLLLALLLATIPAYAGTPLNKTVAAAADGRVQISSVAGSIKITGWSRNQIHIGGTLSRDATRLAVEKTPNGVTIRVVRPHHFHFFGSSEGSHLLIRLPAASHLEVHTVSADTNASGLSGPVRLESVSGDIALTSTSTDIHAKTISGGVTVHGSAPKARIRAHSISGEVRIKTINGVLNASSTSGDIRLTGNNDLQGADLDTTSGDIHFAATLGSKGNYEFRSVSGDVRIQLSAIPGARFDASSLSGDIDTNFGPAPQRTSKYGPGREWHYQSGSGSADLRIHTLSGDIRVHAATH
jgi:DUF4097 and DUF4098 domain-containing protein YvlB